MMREAYRRLVLLAGDLLIFVCCRRYDLVGREHVPRSGGVIVVSNHLNNADPRGTCHPSVGAIPEPVCRDRHRKVMR